MCSISNTKKEDGIMRTLLIITASVFAISIGYSGAALSAPPGEGNVPPGWEKNQTDTDTTTFHGGSQNECTTCEEGGPGVRTETDTAVGPPNNPHSFETSDEDGPNPQGPKN
jgi:hypothetical protein